MKKFLVIGGIALAVLMVLAASVAVFWVGRAYAQTQTPSNPSWGPGMGGRGGRDGGMMGGWRAGGDHYGPMHEYMIAALAEALGLTPEDLQNRINNGETPYEIAQSQGLTDAQIRDLFDQSHDAALQKAVEAGVVTQEQADWMEQHHEQMWQNGGLTNGFGPGAGGCMSGGRGPRGGWNITPTPEP